MDNVAMHRRSHRPALIRRLLFFASILLLVLITGLCGCGGGTPGGEPEGGKAAPTPGATFSGPVDISGVASSGIIHLVISDGGAAITSVGVTLTDLKTETFSAGSMTKQISGAIPIVEGSFAGSLSGLGEIEGRFTSPTAASGTVRLKVAIPLSEASADLGQFAWTAEAGEADSTMPEPPAPPTEPAPPSTSAP